MLGVPLRPIQAPGQLVSALPTALSISVMSTLSPLGMPSGQAEASAVPRSMFTSTMISLTVTAPLPSQSPAHGATVFVGVADTVGVAATALVGDGLGWGSAFASKAPMEQLVAPAPGRTKPRWSRGADSLHANSLPALIAGLAAVHPAGAPTPVHKAIVCVGPPLFCRPAGSSCGSVLLSEPCIVLKPHDTSLSRL